MQEKKFRVLRQTYGLLKGKRESLQTLVNKTAEHALIFEKTEDEFRSKINGLEAIYGVIEQTMALTPQEIMEGDFDNLFEQVSSLFREYANMRNEYDGMAHSLRYLKEGGEERYKAELITLFHRMLNHKDLDTIITPEIRKAVPEIDSLSFLLQSELEETLANVQKELTNIEDLYTQNRVNGQEAYKLLVEKIDPLMKQSRTIRKTLEKQVSKITEDYLQEKKSRLENVYSEALQSISVQDTERFAKVEDIYAGIEEEITGVSITDKILALQEAASRIDNLIEA